MNIIRTAAIIITLLFLIDLYSFKGIRFLVQDIPNDFFRKSLLYLHWILFGFMATGIVVALNKSTNTAPHMMYSWFFYLFGIGFLLYLPKIVFSVFELIDDLLFVIRWGIDKLIPSASEIAPDAPKISRLKFLYQTGAVVAAIPFASIAYGILKGRFDYRVIKEQLSFSNLPESFDGFKVVQISDAHLGSFFNNYEPVEKAVEMVNALNPDIILFTGDLVNNYADEAENWIPVFQKFKAKHGKFSVMGNHDYGDYGRWNHPNDKVASFSRLQDIHREMGFNILMNENQKINIEGEEIAVIGVENWGVKPFPQYGDINKAKQGVEETPFKLLLSHDPSHWDMDVRKNHTDIDITLSGHTHGMQFGVELGNIKWSPVKYKYPRWGGLYQEDNQFLYVNRGFGYIGFPGRVGMPPEITLIELKKA